VTFPASMLMVLDQIIEFTTNHSLFVAV